MTYEELLREYLKRLILVFEAIGRKTGNKVYSNYEQYLEEYEAVIPNLIENEPPFEIAVSQLIAVVILKTHNEEEISGYENSEHLTSLVSETYETYLKTFTNKFLRENGMPPINNIAENYRSTLLCQKKTLE